MAGRSDILAGRAVVVLQVADKMTAPLKAAESSLKAFGAAITAVGGGISAVFGGITIGLRKMATEYTDAADSLTAMSVRTGIGVESLQQLQYLASQNATDINTLELAIRRMQRTISFASLGMVDMNAMLKQIGLSAGALDGLDTFEQFVKVTAAIKNIKDASKQRGQALLWFGKSGTSALPTLDNVEELQAKFKKLRGGMSAEMVRLGDELADELGSMIVAFKGVAHQIGATLQPALLYIAQVFQRAAAAAHEFIAAHPELVKWVSAASVALFAIGGALTSVGAVMVATGYLVGGLAANVKDLATAFVYLRGTALGASLIAVLETAGAAFLALGGTVAVAFPYLIAISAAIAGVALLWNAATDSVKDYGDAVKAATTDAPAKQLTRWVATPERVIEVVGKDMAELEANTQKALSGAEAGATAEDAADQKTADEIENTNARIRRLMSERSTIGQSEAAQELARIENSYEEQLRAAENNATLIAAIQAERAAAVELWAEKERESARKTAEEVKQRAMEQAKAQEQASLMAQRALARQLTGAIRQQEIAGIGGDFARRRAEIAQEYQENVRAAEATDSTRERAAQLRDMKLAQLGKEQGAVLKEAGRENLSLAIEADATLSDMERRVLQLRLERKREEEAAAQDPIPGMTEAIAERYRLKELLLAQEFASKERTRAEGAFGGIGLASQLESTQEGIKSNTKLTAERLAEVNKNLKDIYNAEGLTFN